MSIGLFHTRYIIASPAIGSPVLTLEILVDTPHKRISGQACISQSTFPPLAFHADVWGGYSQPRLDPGSEYHIVMALEGNPAGPASQLADTFHLHAVLDHDWQSGFASYRFVYQGQMHAVEHAAMTVDKAGAGSEATYLPPPHPHPVPLYAAALQQAGSGGDLARMKALASQAQLQLDQGEQIQVALRDLDAEISRLETRR
ncbi:DUF1842 domain-containing protein [Paludibacterium paludis]|uniref:DUF1842 domain-containing protein n=1 Tax=Paludibacterium paludis TaxID=1225769 RepID=A0A918P3W4_9NEIS|nr:DUF1842 domain-containing protein [Paludibacterium paludis]GGY19763.1 hypothetical protein GCM10011289_24000 [Paludibacterium paludis]